jgi:hypothetical protein
MLITGLQVSAVVGHGSRTVDALVTWPGEQFAIEVDGPNPFVSSPGSSCGPPTASTWLRDYVLRQWELQVLSVPVVDLQLHQQRSGAFQHQLESRLRRAGVLFASEHLPLTETE